MLLWSVEAREYLHRIDNLPLFLGFLALLLLGFLEVEEAPLDHEFLAADPLINARVVKFNDIILQLDVLLGIIIEVLQISKKSVGIAIILLIEITPLWHVPNHLMQVRYIPPLSHSTLSFTPALFPSTCSS